MHNARQQNFSYETIIQYKIIMMCTNVYVIMYACISTAAKGKVSEKKKEKYCDTYIYVNRRKRG